MQDYLHRIAESEVEETLSAMGAVLVQGPRAVGKSTIAKHLSKSNISLDSSLSLMEIAMLNPEIILEGKTPRFIDEWQLVPSIWNAVRHEVDRRQSSGQFILAGSATPSDDITRHTGAGRIGRVTLMPMTLFESGHSTKHVNIRKLFDDEASTVTGYGGLTVEEYIQRIIIGGFPNIISKNEKQARLYLSNYLDDISRVNLGTDIVKTDPVRMRALIRAISRNIATEISAIKLAKEAELDTDNLSAQTARKYIDQLSQIFVLQELPAWSTHIRSNVRQRVSPKWFFCCPSLATAALSLSSSKLLRDLNSLGFLFEALAIRDLRVYAHALDGEVFHYRDETGLEVDAIIELRNGEWLACEIKLGGDHSIKEGISSLIKLKNKVVESKANDLLGMCVITAGRESYTHKESGVHIVSLSHLYID
ncbi:MAG: ATP-binding protein [Bacteroidales bacterium]|jgi:predicted AAA+ superfamily ATPase|nr:ATP-binding protein [Bacteroidales bacterium]